jgi:two-component system sensor histidine kinase MtrB
VLSTWRRSLELRTVALTVLLAGVGASIIATSISVSISANLYDQRRDQVQSESQRATILAQSIFDSATATEDADQVELDSLQNEAQSTILGSTSSPGGTSIAILRTPGQSTAQTVQDIASPDFPGEELTPELRERVASDTGALSMQPVALPRADGGSVPGIVVGSTLQVPTAGQYELYLVYDLADAATTLALMQRTLALGSLALVVLIGVITYVVVRTVVGPVRVAAETSQAIAAGDLDQRIPEKGQDVVATLGRSFNGMADGMQRQISQLAELSRVQQRFVSDVSHELRTPLTTIRLAGDVLFDQRGSFTPSAARTAELLHTQVDRFELLLADLLEISRFDAGAVELDVESTTVVALVEDAVAEFEPLAAETRAACAASCATFSATRSSTARGARSRSRSTATPSPSPSRCATTASACAPATSSASSTGSGGPTRPGGARSAAPGWGSPSASRTPCCTAAASRSGRGSARAAASS